jgi:hypothetical protein
MYNPWSAWWANLTWPWVLLFVIVGAIIAAIIAIVIVAVLGSRRRSRGSDGGNRDDEVLRPGSRGVKT